MTQRTLIFDLGMHRGDDADFYLCKGFDVVALEANPQLSHAAADRLASFVRDGHLTIVQKALWKSSEEQVPFYVNRQKDDWSSLFQGWAEKEGDKSERIDTATVTLADLVERYGIPYYIKCDLEGADLIFAEQLLKQDRRPCFVSTEAISPEIFALLLASGYDRFQIVNQALNPETRCPNPAREGRFVDRLFTGHMSGLFGLELAHYHWKSFGEIMEQYIYFMKLYETRTNFGWLDVHAGRSDVLNALFP
jgi:FkbM family methyltransferase